MSTRASVKGHPIHAMLVPLPIGLWIFALVADVMTHAGGAPGWRTAAFYAIGVGVIGALLAALPGLVDLLSLGPGPSRGTGIRHMVVNLVAVAVFAINFLMRLKTADHSGHLLLTALGVVLIGISGWLGGEMVYVGGVGVAPAARETAGPRPR
jgi:uncharacterized membrane protein